MAEQKETKNPVQSAERIFQVMEMLADHGEMGLMEISTALGLHKSTVHRLLMSLVYMGYAKQDEVSQKYMLSYKIVSMAGKMLDRMDILQVAKTYMERLSDISGETVHLVQREGNNILYIYKIEAKIGTIRMVSHVGMVHPMYCSGVGKAIMAELPESEVKQIWNESIIEKKTEHTITDYDEMLRVLKEAKKNGYALDDEENEEGVRCIAASLRDYHNEVKYAFSISGPTSRMTRERVEELSVDVKKVQEELSMELGWYRK
jgi:DNA-binding IclR family transcriptional regulator